MPIKIFAAPGDHRDDFKQVEQQVNTWIAETCPRIVSLHPMVNEIPGRPEHGGYMLTLVAYYEDATK